MRQSGLLRKRAATEASMLVASLLKVTPLPENVTLGKAPNEVSQAITHHHTFKAC